MKFFLLTFIMIFIVFPVAALVVETASFTDFLIGTTDNCAYDNWISHVSEGIALENYNLYAPYDRQMNGFGDFTVAGTEQLQSWEDIVTQFLAGEYVLAELLLNSSGFPYEIVEFHDLDTDCTYYLLREQLNYSYYDNNGTPADPADDEQGSFDFGWGLHVYNPQSGNPVIITAVHPNDDYFSPIIALECFREWDAMFLQISGAGREVKWTEQGSYTNTKSLSDPSRNTNHAYTRAYQLFCNKIREIFGRREFSAQIHSYDWNRHTGYANCQISAGFEKRCPNLPIRDLSDLKLDVINASSHIIHPANSVGVHLPVYLNDFYAVNYQVYEFYFTDGDTTYTVNNQVDLEGYSQNRQMLYTSSGWNNYDVFEPFFHLEMDELPNCYEQTEDNLNWFYGYDNETGNFDMDNLFSYTQQYYRPFIEAMTAVLPFTLELNDELVPPDPLNFNVLHMGYDEITLAWDKISSFDFQSYEILYATDHIEEENFEIYDRQDDYHLASPSEKNVIIPNLVENQQYYFRMRGRDYNGNYSELTPEIYAVTAPTVITQFLAVGEDDQAIVHWTTGDQTGNMGFRLYRRRPDEEFILLDSYHTNPDLLGGEISGQEYIYLDQGVQNDTTYIYRIGSVNFGAFEYLHQTPAHCYPRPIYQLIATTESGSYLDSAAFAANPAASDDYDEYYDLLKEDPPVNDYLYAAFYETDWDDETVYLEREIFADFDPESAVKTWQYTIRTDQLTEPVIVSVSDNYYRNTEKLYLLNTENGELVDLTQGSMTVHPQNDDYLDFRLFWGDLMPTAYFITQDNRIYREQEPIEFNWYINYPAMIREIDLFLLGSSDSLLIAAGLPGNADHYEWQVPSNLELHNMRPVMDIYTEHAEQIRRMASYYLGMVPAVTVLPIEANHQLLSDPWTDFIIYPDFLLGNNNMYSLIPGEGYLPAENMSFGAGYWLTSDYEQNLYSDAQIWQDNYGVFLEPGWNLIANPHLCSYQYYDLKFMFGTTSLNFSQAVTNNLIVNSLYGLVNGSYQLLNTIPAKKSFLIYANADSGTPLQCIFRPYNHSFYIAPTPDWTITIAATQDGIDSDAVTLGASRQTSADFDYEFDIPEPPNKPYSPGLSFYFPKDTAVDTLFLYEKLDREFKTALDSNLPDSECWFFTMEVESLEPITVSADYVNTPAGYWARMYLEEEILPLIENEPVTFSPVATGLISGEIWVYNHFFNAADNPLKPVNLNVYPNPFNPATTISYQLPPGCCEAELNIYNIRGQLVKAFIIDHSGERSGRFRENSIIWNGENSNGKRVASGIYFVSLKTGSSAFRKKMVLVK